MKGSFTIQNLHHIKCANLNVLLFLLCLVLLGTPEINCPNPLPLVAQAAIPELCPANFFTTFLVESSLSMLPKVEVTDALISSILGSMSWT